MGRLKAFLAVTLATVVASATLFALTLLQKRLLFSGAESYRFYLGNTSADCREVFASPTEAPLMRVFLKEVNGECATYSSLDIEQFLEEVDGEILFWEENSGGTSYYCKADLPYSTALYGKTVNLHICVKESGVTVASPIIFGGY